MERLLTAQRNCFYKDIHIHVLIKTVEGQDVESIQQRLITTAHTEYAKRGKYAYNNMLLSHSCERLSKHEYAASDVLTIVGEDYQDTKANKINWQRAALVKTEEQKYY